MGPHLGPLSGPESGTNESSTHCWCWFGWSHFLGRKMGPDLGSFFLCAPHAFGLVFGTRDTALGSDQCHVWHRCGAIINIS